MICYTILYYDMLCYTHVGLCFNGSSILKRPQKSLTLVIIQSSLLGKYR